MPYETGADANTPLPYNMSVALPFKLTVAMLPIPDTFATATLLAVVANDTAPDTLAPATLFAVVANHTAPDTFAPGIEVNPVAAP